MSHMSRNAWAEKARLLDRYRWRVWRSQHGVLGSTVRFLRDAVGDLLFGILSRFRLANMEIAKSCDFLLLQSAPKVLPLRRKERLVQAVRDRGYQLVDTALPERMTLLRNRLLKAPLQDVPLRYYGYAAYAEWLVSGYQPKIILNDRNGSIYAPFLRLSLNERGRLLVHLAHAATTESSIKLGMNDYDYYFLFGQSSMDALQARPLRFGSSRVVLSGSYLIDDSYDLPPAEPKRKRILILGVGPDKEKQSGYLETYRLLQVWARRNANYDVAVKLHPRSKGEFWLAASEEMKNVKILDCSLAAALTSASVVINIMSNAVIEAALAKRPIVHVNLSRSDDIFNQEPFFGPAIVSVSDLERKLSYIEEHYGAAVKLSEDFATYHLANGVGGLNSTVLLLERLLQGGFLNGQPLLDQGFFDEQRRDS